MGILHIEYRISLIADSKIQIKTRWLSADLIEEPRSIPAHFLHQVGQVIAFLPFDILLLTVPQTDQLHDDDLQPEGSIPTASGTLQPCHMAVMVAPHILMVSQTGFQLVPMVGDIRCKIGGNAIVLYQHSSLSPPNLMPQTTAPSFSYAL